MPPQPDSVPVEDKQQIKEILKEIKDEIAKEARGVTKPKEWSRNSVSPYYRVKFALELKAVIDEMLITNDDKIWYYEKFAKQPFKFTPSTLYSYVYQACKYLEEQEIPGVDREFYKKLMERVIRTREPGVGVRISFHTDIPAAYVDIVPDTVVKKSEIFKLKNAVDEWLEKAAIGDLFSAEKLGLSPEEVIEFQNIYSGTEHFLAVDISTETLTIRKIA